MNKCASVGNTMSVTVTGFFTQKFELHACQSDQNEFLTGAMGAFRAITGRAASIM